MKADVSDVNKRGRFRLEVRCGHRADFAPWREHLRSSRGLATGPELAGHLLQRYGMGVLPASAFGEGEHVLRMRVATGLLYGETAEQQEAALESADPVALPWIAAALSRIDAILAGLAR